MTLSVIIDRDADRAIGAGHYLPTSLTAPLSDPPPRARIKLVEWHLTARTRQPARRLEFVTVIQPHRVDAPCPAKVTLKQLPGGYALEAALGRDHVVVLLRARPDAPLRAGDISTDADLGVVRYVAKAEALRLLELTGGTVRVDYGRPDPAAP